MDHFTEGTSPSSLWWWCCGSNREHSTTTDVSGRRTQTLTCFRGAKTHSTQLMADEVRKAVQELLTKVPGLLCVLITDRDGVPVLKAHTDQAPELAMRTGFLATFGLAVDQGGKLGLGKTKTLICSYSQYQIVQMNKQPLVVSFIASDTCNTGHILGLERLIDPLLGDLTTAVAEVSSWL